MRVGQQYARTGGDLVVDTANRRSDHRPAGVTSPSEATKWTIAQVTPAEVAGWSAAGLDATDAVRAFRVGLDLSTVRALPNPRTDLADLFRRRFGDASITVTHSSMPAPED